MYTEFLEELGANVSFSLYSRLLACLFSLCCGTAANKDVMLTCMPVQPLPVKKLKS